MKYLLQAITQSNREDGYLVPTEVTVEPIALVNSVESAKGIIQEAIDAMRADLLVELKEIDPSAEKPEDVDGVEFKTTIFDKVRMNRKSDVPHCTLAFVSKRDDETEEWYQVTYQLVVVDNN